MTEQRPAKPYPRNQMRETAAPDQRRPQPRDQRQQHHEPRGAQRPARLGAKEPLRGEELHQQILESIRPMLRDLQREVEESVQQICQTLTQPAQEGWPALATAGQQASEPPHEQIAAQNHASQAARSRLQQVMQQTTRALRQTTAWLVDTLRALLQAVRDLLQAVAALLKTRADAQRRAGSDTVAASTAAR